MALGAGTILSAYVRYALTTPSAIMRTDFPSLTFRPSMSGGDGTQGPGAQDGTWAFAALIGESTEVSDFATDGSGRPVYKSATGAVVVRVNDPPMGHGAAYDLAQRYADATRTALFTGPWTSFVDHASGRAMSLNHFQLVLPGIRRRNPSTIQHIPAAGGNPGYFMAITRYYGTARPTD